MLEWTPIDIVVMPTIHVRYCNAILEFAEAKTDKNGDPIVLGKLYACPLLKVKGKDAGKPYDAGTIKRQTNDVLHGKLGAEFRKAHPVVTNVHLKSVGEDQAFWYRTK